jgi:hypothetical protein
MRRRSHTVATGDVPKDFLLVFNRLRTLCHISAASHFSVRSSYLYVGGGVSK